MLEFAQDADLLLQIGKLSFALAFLDDEFQSDNLASEFPPALTYAGKALSLMTQLQLLCKQCRSSLQN